MQVQVNTDNHIEGGAELTREIEMLVGGALGRFSDWITRVEVYLSDENSSSKSSDSDKRCIIEARPAGLRPLSVGHQAATVAQALDGAVEKLARLLDDTAGRLGHSKGRTPRGDRRPL